MRYFNSANGYNLYTLYEGLISPTKVYKNDNYAKKRVLNF